MRLIGYIRVSTTDQLDGYGPDSQRADIQRWADANGAEIIEWVTDDISGTVIDRPGLGRILERIGGRWADGLVIARLDRLARALTAQEAILGAVWSLDGIVVSADQGVIHQDDPDDPMRTAMRQMAGVWAELERRMIVARLRKGRAAKRAAGGWGGGPAPFGWELENGVLVENPDEQVLVDQIIAYRLDERLGFKAIAQKLNSLGVTTKLGRPWHAMSVKRVCDRHIRKEMAL